MARFCSNCGKQITEGGAFCSACGKPVSQSRPAMTSAAPPVAVAAPIAVVAPVMPVMAKKKSKAPLIIAGLAVLVLVFALVGLFTQGFGLLGDTEETSGSIGSGSETPSQENTPPATTPSPESPAPAITPSPEVTPSETPTPEEPTPGDTPPPESPPPELPPNHISAEFLDLLRNGDYFYLSYLERPIEGELYGDLQYANSNYGEQFIEEARNGGLYTYRLTTRAHMWYRHYVYIDNKVYTLFHQIREYFVFDVVSGVGSSPNGVAQGGLSFCADEMFSFEFAGSGLGAINGVQMTYDDYAETIFGRETGRRVLVYLYDDKVAYVVDYQIGALPLSFSFIEVGRDIPPTSFDISYAEISRNIPPDMFDIDYVLESYRLTSPSEYP